MNKFRYLKLVNLWKKKKESKNEEKMRSTFEKLKILKGEENQWRKDDKIKNGETMKKTKQNKTKCILASWAGSAAQLWV